jgi:hypothetical protein
VHAFAGEDPAASSSVFRAGAKTVDITPPAGLPMWGYGGRRDLPSRGVRDPLEANVVVLDFGPQSDEGAQDDPEAAARGGRLALVGLDLGRAPARRTMARLREKVLAEAGVAHLLVVGSHTHHGPCLELETVEPTAAWIREMADKVAAATADAARAARPAKLAVGSCAVELNRNRHSKIAPKPVDSRLTVIRLDGVDGKSIATVVNFAAHPTTLPWDLFEYSADFPGPMKNRVEEAIGGVCVFLQGAAGDQSANRGGKSTEEYGAALAEEVVRLSRTLEPAVPPAPSLAVRGEELVFERMRVDLKDPVTRLRYTLAFFKSLVDAYAEEYEQGVRPLLQVAVLNGEVGLVGVSGEFFASHAVRLRERARLRELLFLGYANGYHQYFPTIEAVAEGGYGADPEVSPVEIGAGERMMDRALFHLYDLRKPLAHAKR